MKLDFNASVNKTWIDMLSGDIMINVRLSATEKQIKFGDVVVNISQVIKDNIKVVEITNQDQDQ